MEGEAIEAEHKCSEAPNRSQFLRRDERRRDAHYPSHAVLWRIYKFAIDRTKMPVDRRAQAGLAGAAGQVVAKSSTAGISTDTPRTSLQHAWIPSVSSHVRIPVFLQAPENHNLCESCQRSSRTRRGMR